MTDVLEKAQQRGYWRIVIRPSGYETRRVENTMSLFDIVRSTSVSLRGWDFPHVDENAQPVVGQDYVEQSIDWSGFVELWRLFESGQFYYLGAFHHDWMQEHWAGFSQAGDPTQTMPATSTVFRLTEIFEFAARLSLSPVGAPSMKIQIALHNLKGRRLANDNPKRSSFSRERICSVNEYIIDREVERDELVATSRDLALTAASDLFARFTWQPTREMLQGMQDELYRGS